MLALLENSELMTNQLSYLNPQGLSSLALVNQNLLKRVNAYIQVNLSDLCQIESCKDLKSNPIAIRTGFYDMSRAPLETLFKVIHFGQQRLIGLSLNGKLMASHEPKAIIYFDEDKQRVMPVLKVFSSKISAKVLFCDYGFIICTDSCHVYSCLSSHNILNISSNANLEEFRALSHNRIRKVITDGFRIIALLDDKRVYVWGGYSTRSLKMSLCGDCFSSRPLLLKGCVNSLGVSDLELTLDKRIVILMDNGSAYCFDSKGLLTITMLVFPILQSSIFNMASNEKRCCLAVLTTIFSIPALILSFTKMQMHKQEGDLLMSVFNTRRLMNRSNSRFSAFFYKERSLYIRCLDGTEYNLEGNLCLQPIFDLFAHLYLQQDITMKSILDAFYRLPIKLMVYFYFLYWDEIKACFCSTVHMD